jgi:hypothetical protein
MHISSSFKRPTGRFFYFWCCGVKNKRAGIARHQKNSAPEGWDVTVRFAFRHEISGGAMRPFCLSLAAGAGLLRLTCSSLISCCARPGITSALLRC